MTFHIQKMLSPSYLLQKEINPKPISRAAAQHAVDLVIQENIVKDRFSAYQGPKEHFNIQGAPVVPIVRNKGLLAVCGDRNVVLYDLDKRTPLWNCIDLKNLDGPAPTLVLSETGVVVLCPPFCTDERVIIPILFQGKQTALLEFDSVTFAFRENALSFVSERISVMNNDIFILFKDHFDIYNPHGVLHTVCPFQATAPLYRASNREHFVLVEKSEPLQIYVLSAHSKTLRLIDAPDAALDSEHNDEVLHCKDNTLFLGSDNREVIYEIPLNNQGSKKTYPYGNNGVIKQITATEDYIAYCTKSNLYNIRVIHRHTNVERDIVSGIECPSLSFTGNFLNILTSNGILVSHITYDLTNTDKIRRYYKTHRHLAMYQVNNSFEEGILALPQLDDDNSFFLYVEDFHPGEPSDLEATKKVRYSNSDLF